MKYGNKKTPVQYGDRTITFDSKKEAERFQELIALQKAGEIVDIWIQYPFELQPAFEVNGHKYRAITYIADFVYTKKDGSFVVEDVKGYRTEVYKIKRKMFAYKYKEEGIEVVEV